MNSTNTSKAKVQKPAPAFSGNAWTADGFKNIKLEDYLGKWVVLFFYPLDFTFVCPTEICNFSDSTKIFSQMNVEVIGCSTDSHFSHREWALKPRKQGGLAPLACPLLSDNTQQISKDYGVLIEEEGIALRATFLIDPKGVLRQYSINDLPVGRNVDEVIRLIQAFQFADKHGEVCPSKWKPGKRTMVPEIDSDKTKSYFEEEHVKQDS